MDWIDYSAALLAIIFVAMMIAFIRLRKLEEQVHCASIRITEDQARYTELQYLTALRFQLEDTPSMAETLVESGVTSLQGIHKDLSRIPFGLMKSIPLVGDAGIEQTHDLLADTLYNSIMDMNKIAAKAGQEALHMRRKQWEKRLGKTRGEEAAVNNRS